MNLKEYINDNKVSIIILACLLYLVYQDACNNKTIEKMSDDNNEDNAEDIVKRYYKPDVKSIRKLSKLLKGYIQDGFVIPGNLSVDNLEISSDASFLKNNTIIAFYGETIPKGWVLCDGNNGTPDLRSRMILGSGKGTGRTNRQLNDKGGVEKVSLTVDQMPKHKHNIKEDGAHEHSYNLGWYGHHSGGCSDAYKHANSGSHAKSYSHEDHQHDIEKVGSGAEHENMPPYYVLVWIMKVNTNIGQTDDTQVNDNVSSD